MTTAAKVLAGFAAATGLLSSAAMADGMLPERSVHVAAPVPVAAPYGWTGAYLGLNAGIVRGSSDTNSRLTCPTGPCDLDNGPDLAGPTQAGTGSLGTSAFTGGVQGGYNWQRGDGVFGVETDFGSFGLNRSRTVTGVLPQVIPPGQTQPDHFAATTEVAADWLFTARLRAGWLPAEDVLVYVTGGLALTDLRTSNRFTDVYAPYTAGASQGSSTEVGWTVGAGVEWARDHDWTIKAEYLFVDFGSVTTASAISSSFVASPAHNPGRFTTEADLSAHIFRIGLNRRF